MEEKESETPIVDKSLEILDQLKKEPLNVEKQIELLRTVVWLHNPETHVPIAKVKWRRFGDLFPIVGRELITFSKQFKNIRTDETILCYDHENLLWVGECENYIDEDYYCYASEVNLSEWLPK